MRHVIAGLLILAAFVGGAVLWRGGGSGDPLGARDALVEGDVVVVYEPQTVGTADAAFTLTWLRGEGWIKDYSRTVDGVVYPNVVLFDGRNAVRQLAPGCYEQATWSPFFTELPPIPGVTVVNTLLSGTRIEDSDEADTYEYELEVPEMGTWRVTEDLTAAGDGVVVAKVQPVTFGMFSGTFTITRLDGEARRQALATLREAHPSEMGSVTIRLRYSFSDESEEPYPVEVPRDCPGDGSVWLPLARDASGGWLVEGVYPLGVSIEASRLEIEADLATAEPASVRLREGATFSREKSPFNEGTAIVQIVSCEPEAWLPC